MSVTGESISRRNSYNSGVFVFMEIINSAPFGGIVITTVDGNLLPSGGLESILSMATNSEHLKVFFSNS